MSEASHWGINSSRDSLHGKLARAISLRSLLLTYSRHAGGRHDLKCLQLTNFVQKRLGPIHSDCLRFATPDITQQQCQQTTSWKRRYFRITAPETTVRYQLAKYSMTSTKWWRNLVLAESPRLGLLRTSRGDLDHSYVFLLVAKITLGGDFRKSDMLPSSSSPEMPSTNVAHPRSWQSRATSLEQIRSTKGCNTCEQFWNPLRLEANLARICVLCTCLCERHFPPSNAVCDMNAYRAISWNPCSSLCWLDLTTCTLNVM